MGKPAIGTFCILSILAGARQVALADFWQFQSDHDANTPVVTPLLLDDAPKPVAKPPSSAAFPAGTSSFEVYGNYMADLSNRRTTLGGGTIGVGHYFVDNVSLNLEASGYDLDVSDHRGIAGSFSALLRNHFYCEGNFSFFMDVGFGAIEADHVVPERGTQFNFMFHTGPGITWRLDENLYLLGGVRYFHLSNAEMDGRHNNPSVNGLEGYLGIMKLF